MTTPERSVLAVLAEARNVLADAPLLDRAAALHGLPPDEYAREVNARTGTAVLGPADLVSLDINLRPLTLTFCIERAVLLAQRDSQWVLCADDPWDSNLVAHVSNLLGAIPDVYWARKNDVLAVLHAYRDRARAVEQVIDRERPVADDDPLYAISIESIEALSNPVVRFIDAAILDGWRSGASDIHLETTREAIALKYRLDGVLIDVTRFDDARRIEEVLNRIKVIAGLDISERRIPQDGRFRAHLDGRYIDFRVSIMPSIHGEDAVIRILDKSQLNKNAKGITLKALGIPEDVETEILALAHEPHGMLLVTGPTGSGKTTTLYAVLSETQSPLEKIITIEDPVEYELPGVLQIPVNEKKGLTFSRGLRSILRHDPDRLLVGEIRDAETAEIAVQAALTGHGVLTTVHANNGFDAVNRFVHMGVDLHAFTASVNGIVSQRLMRRVCDQCATAQAATPALAHAFEEVGLALEAAHLQAGKGCAACRFTGYRGRFAVAEVLRVDDAFRHLIISRASIIELKAAAQALSARTLRERALRCVWQGMTTEEEFRRVVAAQ